MQRFDGEDLHEADRRKLMQLQMKESTQIQQEERRQRLEAEREEEREHARYLAEMEEMVVGYERANMEEQRRVNETLKAANLRLVRGEPGRGVLWSVV